jgi:hypothetical protein
MISRTGRFSPAWERLFQPKSEQDTFHIQIKSLKALPKVVVLKSAIHSFVEYYSWCAV